MIRLLNSVLDEVVEESDEKNSDYSETTHGAARAKIIKKLYKLTDLDPAAGLHALELKMLVTLAKVLLINTGIIKGNRKELINQIFKKYDEENSKRIEALTPAEKEKFLNEFKKEANQRKLGYFTNNKGEIESFISENYNIALIGGSALGLGIASVSLLKIRPKYYAMGVTAVAGVLARIGAPRLVLFGLGGAFFSTLFGIFTVFQGYQYFKGRKTKALAALTMSLVIKYTEINERVYKQKYLQYLSDLMDTGDRITKELKIIGVQK